MYHDNEKVIKNYDELRNKHDLFLDVEGECLYHLEDVFFTNKVMLTDSFQEQVNSFKTMKATIGSLKKIVEPVMKKFHLEDVKIKKTHAKSADSYYHDDKKTIYIHDYLFNDIKEDPENHNYYEEILFYFYHELAHAFTNIYIHKNSCHDSNFIYSMIKIFSYVSNINEEELKEELLDLNYYKNNAFWNDHFNFVATSYYNGKQIEDKVKELRNAFGTKNIIDRKVDLVHDREISIMEDNLTTRVIRVKQVNEDWYFVSSFSLIESFLAQRVKQSNLIKKFQKEKSI